MYLPLDFVTMRTGGASTQGFASHKQIMSDHQLAFKKNGVYSNVFMECLRYVYKIFEKLGIKDQDYEIFIVICVCHGIADGGEVDLFPSVEFCKA